MNMNEMILDTRGLPESLMRLLRTDRFKVRDLDGEVRLTPIR